MGPERVGDEEVASPVRGEGLGLGQRRDGQPGRAGALLEPGDLGGLVGLGVRSQGHTE